jgi:hypothetical protein
MCREIGFIVAGFVVALTLGFGSSKAPEAAGGGADPVQKPDDPPGSITKEELATKKAKLAEVEKAIAAREKELADLRLEANGLRKLIAAAEAPKDKVYRTGPELLADMPKDAYPKAGPQGGIERAAARKWLKANVVGRTVEWTMTVREVSDTGDDPFHVEVLVLSKAKFVGNKNNTVQPAEPFGDEFLLDGESWQITLIGAIQNLGGDGLTSRISYTTCTAAEVKTLRKLKGKKVVLRATVTAAELPDKGIVDSTNKESGVGAILLTVSLPSADGFIPEASKGKKKSP